MLRVEGTEDEINRESDDGSLPLHIAVGTNRIKNTLLLLREGSPPNAANHAGNTALQLCARIQNVDIAKALLAAGAKLGLQNQAKETPLSAASSYGNEELSKYLQNISTRAQERYSFNRMLKKYLPELCDDTIDERPPPPLDRPARKAKTLGEVDEKEVVSRVSGQLKSIREKLTKLERIDVFRDMPPLEVDPSELEEIPDGCAEQFPFELIDELRSEYL